MAAPANTKGAAKHRKSLGRTGPLRVAPNSNSGVVNKAKLREAPIATPITPQAIPIRKDATLMKAASKVRCLSSRVRSWDINNQKPLA